MGSKTYEDVGPHRVFGTDTEEYPQPFVEAYSMRTQRSLAWLSADAADVCAALPQAKLMHLLGMFHH